MTERCEPPEPLRGQDGWHWLECTVQGVVQIEPDKWFARTQSWDAYGPPERAAGYHRQRYHSECPSSETVAALRAENARLREALSSAELPPAEGWQPIETARRY